VISEPTEFNYRSEWGKSMSQIVIDVLRQVGVYRLCYSDGCRCGSFSIYGVDVRLECGKGIGGPQGVHVSSGSIDWPASEMQIVGEEVARQWADLNGGDWPITVEKH
jgi:hypothetical protein